MRFAIAALLIVGLAAVYFLWPGPDVRAGSVEVPDASVRVGTRLPREYSAVYRLETYAGGDVNVSTERVVVRRPFEATVVAMSGPPPGGKRLSETVNALGRLKTDRLVLAVPPAPASSDRRPDRLLPEAVRDGYAESREVRRVAGRLCRVYRTADAPGALSLSPVADVGDSYTDFCVDEAGLVLEEVGVNDGKLLTRRVAVGVDEDPEIEESFEIGEATLPVRQGGGSVRELQPSSRPPGTFWELDEPPDGFEHEGRYSVVPPQTGFDDPEQAPGIVAFASDVWVDGIEVIIVEQGATSGGTPPFAKDPNAKSVRIGDLGTGEVVYSLAGAEVRVLLEGGAFVRVLGTVPPSRLVEVAEDLKEVEGGDELQLLDEESS